MNKIPFFLGVLFLASYFAVATVPRQYKLDLQLSMNGKLVSSPKMIVNEGQKAEISEVNKKTGNGTFLEVATQRLDANPDKQAILQIVIGKITKGKREIVSSPQIVALENEEASMEENTGNRQVYKISAVVTREVEKKAKRAKKSSF